MDRTQSFEMSSTMTLSARRDHMIKSVLGRRDLFVPDGTRLTPGAACAAAFDSGFSTIRCPSRRRRSREVM